jgi:ATP-dependent Lon protease
MFETFFGNQEKDDDTEFMPIIPMEDDGSMGKMDKIPGHMPILALKNTVLYPGVIIPITVGRDKSIKSIKKAFDTSSRAIGVLSQRDIQKEDPGKADLYEIGTVAKIMKLLRMPDGTTTAILRGQKRFRLDELTKQKPYLEGSVSLIEDQKKSGSLEFTALISTIMDMAKKIIELSPNIPSEAIAMLKSIEDNSFLLNFIASNLNSTIEVKQLILETDDQAGKAELILGEISKQLQLLEFKDQIETKVRVDIDKQQRDYFLNQQLKTIQDELGQNPQEEEISRISAKAENIKWSEKTAKHFQKELTRLKRINPHSPDYSMQITYLDLLTELPWDKTSTDIFDLNKVKKTLDADHFGLEKVKERIIEHLAVLKLKGDMKAPIICLVGPPGVGKTSLGKSVAKALGRNFIRMSLGGISDESEIRGHRKTYIGAMPGRIIQSLRRSGTNNPVFILDEIDKINRDFRGDPSSALLEVLDPEQNSTFQDNYLELEFDLSKVLFIATANSLSTIQPALLDRMEIIEISGYSVEEKMEIAKKYLIPEQLEAHGLQKKHIKWKPAVLEFIIQHYTQESGVRNLSRQIASVMRTIAKWVAGEEEYQPELTNVMVNKFLGPTIYSPDQYTEIKTPGVAIGLAWTQMGGAILFVESCLAKGNGKLIMTGNLGDVMKESATTALSFVKAHAEELNIDMDLLEKRDIHLHMPEGAIPKDGPSAGITMLSAITSIYTGRKVRPFLAMTGEITLRGKVLPVGGIKEKILAAKRVGMKDIILCKENEKHILEINPDYIKGLNFKYVTDMFEVLHLALEPANK